MNESHDHGITPSHGHGSADHGIAVSGGPGQPPLQFTEQEWEQFQQSDRGAGKSVVLLMAGIFGIGLALYSLVAYICWFNVM